MNTEQLVDAVRRLVEVESPTEDVDACARVVEECRQLSVEWLPRTARVDDHGGRPVLRWGSEQPRVLLLGHLDTVWPAGSIERLPWAVSGDRMSGPGVFDMKAGVVQAMAALSQCHDVADIGLMLTTDEETGSATSRDLILSAAEGASAVLVFEPSADGALKTQRKGMAGYSLTFLGRAAHAGLEPSRGINALLLAAEFARSSSLWGDDAVGTTVTPTVISGGTTANTVPATTTLSIDVRAWSQVELERVDRLMQGWTTREGAVRVLGGIDRAPMELHTSAPLFQLAREVARQSDVTLEGVAVGGCSDGNLTAGVGIPTLDGLGAVGDGAHAEHEWASVNALNARSQLAAGIIVRLTSFRR